MANFILFPRLEVVNSLLGNGRGAGQSFIDTYFTTPLGNDVSVYTTFVSAIVGILSLIGGLRIYNKWMQGEENIQLHVFRWVAAIMAVTLSLGALKYIAKEQTRLSDGFKSDEITNTW